MTGSPSSPTASTAQNSIGSLNLPIITYVGRPLDSRKGLTCLLDAIEILNATSHLPKFNFWLVGGSSAEASAIQELIRHRSRLCQLQVEGRIFLWSRVDNNALREIYSRSCALVVPSTREQFGIVAVEAMMCGCPVVASSTGGLQDIVVSGSTGTLVPVDRPELFAAALSGYLRNPELRLAYGANGERRAQALFDSSKSYSQFESIYSGVPEERDRSSFDSSELHDLECYRKRLVPWFQKILGSKAKIIGELPSRQHRVFQVDSETNAFVCKLYHRVPSDHAAVYPLAPELKPPVVAQEFIARTRFHQHGTHTPTVVAVAEDLNAILFERHQPMSFRSSEDWQHSLAKMAETVSAFATLPDDDRDLLALNGHLIRMSRYSSLNEVHTYDRLASILNARVTGQNRRFAQVHPQVELVRMIRLIRDKAWPLPTSFARRALALAEAFLPAGSLILEAPRLCHGSLKPEHVLRAGARELVCDLEHSRYVVGPLDIVHHLFRRTTEERGMPGSLRTIRSLTTANLQFTLASCWFAVYLLFGAVRAFVYGDVVTFDRLNHALRTWPEAYYQTAFIP